MANQGSAHCGLCAADMWAVLQDFSKILIGATVYGYASNLYGHVGINIGNENVVHNIFGTVKVQSLESRLKDFKGFSWGERTEKSFTNLSLKIKGKIVVLNSEQALLQIKNILYSIYDNI